MEDDGLRAEDEFFVLFGSCQERLEKRVLETALFSLFSVRENNWENMCWKLRCFPYLVLAQIMKGGKYIVSGFKLAACLHGNC